MSFTSYAPNFDDVLLWRALRDVGPGYYIDTAPAPAGPGSATQAFYQRGWRGLNLAATPALARALREARPADVTLDGAAAAEAGSALVYEVAGAATRDAALAQRRAAAGAAVRQREIALHPLDALCAAHAAPAIHFLRLGDDADAALAGLDLRRWRPWVVVAAGGARAALLGHGYTLAHDDGQQCYYADAARPALAEALRLPPHPADDFQLCEDHPYGAPLAPWRERVAQAEAAAQESRTWAMAHVQEWKDKHYLLSTHALRAERAEAALAQMTERAERAEQAGHAERDEHARARALAQGEIGALGARAAQAEATLHAVYQSVSWRATLPLRLGNLYVGRARRRARGAAGRVKRAAAAAVKGVLRRVVRFVVARPALAFFVRRQAARFPPLVRVLRRVAMRSQTQAQAVEAGQAPPSAELQHLPAAARQVYDDLRRAAPRR